LTEFAKAVLSKYTFSFETGMFVVSDKNHLVKDNNWTYPSFRADSSQITPMNDIDHLNAYLQYQRPTADTLMNDYINYTGDADLTLHPRLLVNKEDFAYLKSKVDTDEFYKSMYNNIMTKAQSYMPAAPVVYEFEDAMRAMNPANTMLTRFMHWGYAYNMTGEVKYAERAFKEFEAAAKFPDYNTSHIIDTGTYVMALAVGYDWLYNGFTPEQREFAARVCHEQALKVLASGMYGRLTSTSAGTNMYGAFRWRSNYNSIIVGGVINAALATAEVDPEYCFEIISLGLRSMEYSLSELMPGGGWNEAPGYWNYAMQFFNYAFATMNSSFGNDYGLTKSMGMESTLNYAIASLGAYGNNNFHDSGITVGTNSYSAFAYLARHFKNKSAFDMRIADIKGRRASAGMEDVLYYKPEVYADSQDSTDTVNYVEGIELFSVRDSLDSDESEFFFSTHFGTTSGYHQHTDTSTFVLDMYDMRWAEDLGSENYNLQNEQGYGDADLYRKRGEGHNIIVINPAKYGPTSYVDGMPKGASKEQVNNKFIPIERREYDDSQAIVTADMTEAYTDVNSMQTVYFVDRDKQTVTMRSEFELVGESEVYWFMHTSASISIDGSTAYLTKGGKTIKIQVSTNAEEYELLSMAAQPLPTSPQVPTQNANSGYRKLAVKMNTDGYTTLTVKISPEDDPEAVSTKPISQWCLDSRKQETDVLVQATDFEAIGNYAIAPYDEVSGAAGKTAEDESVKFSNSGSCMSFDLSEAQLGRYLIMSANVMTVDAATKLSYSMGESMISDYPLMELNRWNQVKVVADLAGGKAATVVNGEQGTWYDCSFDGDILTINVNGDGENVLYLDDISISTANEYVESVYPSLNKVFAVSDGYINVQDGMTAKYIARRSELPYVAVYADSSCTQQLPDDQQIVEGNAVVAGDGENMVMYIAGNVAEAADGTISWINAISDDFEGNSYNVNRANSATVYGIGGKQPWDGAWELSYITNTYTESDAFFQQALTDAQAAGTVVFTMDIYPTDTISKFMIATGGHRAISKQVEMPSQLLNRWSRVVYVFHGDTATAQLYINDELVETRQNVALSSNAVRFIAYVSDKTAESKFYLDNVNIYAGDIDIKPLSSSKYTVATDSITVGSGQSVYDVLLSLEKTFDRYDIRVYNDVGGIALNRENVTSDMTVVVMDGSNIVRQYSVK
ncbi:MAG: hypothetical protein IJ365_03965, partial [Clostridia bacterium]|nr:hypothetical protein [Clostridia bacterium]